MASLTFRYYKIQFRPGLHPGPCWQSLRRSPRPCGEGDTPSPFPTSVDDFGAWLARPLFRCFRCLWLPHVISVSQCYSEL